MQNERTRSIVIQHLMRDELDRLANLSWGDSGETTRVLFALLSRLGSPVNGELLGQIARCTDLPVSEVRKAIRELLAHDVIVGDSSGHLRLAGRVLPKAS